MEKPSLCRIFICFTTVLLPDSPAPNDREKEEEEEEEKEEEEEEDKEEVRKKSLSN